MTWSRLLVLSLILGCSGPAPRSPAAPTAGSAKYHATIRWTEYGIPHIEAGDLGSLAFGQGYAFARQHICILADQIVRVRGERARYFGPGPGRSNVDTDFGYLALGLRENAEAALSRVSEDGRAVVAGYVAGYNHYLAVTGRDHLPAPCRGAEWVVPIEPVDLVAYGLDIAIMASGDYFVSEIGAARPHAPDEVATGPRSSGWPPPRLEASNGWAIGADRSTSGHGLLVANPHFPWEGPFQFYESQLTIPGKLDAYGVNLLGMPMLGIGFNRHLGWTHTFSASRQFAVYRLALVADDPTRYHYGDQIREMTHRDYTIAVRQPDGSLTRLTRTLYRSHYGPMIDGAALRWDTGASTAFTLRDAAAEAWNGLDQYLAMMRAENLEQFEAALARYDSTPFLNTLYADRDGNALYVDGSRVPDLDDAAMMAWRLAVKTVPAVRQAWINGVIALDGSLPLFEWRRDPAAVAPGTVPLSRAPRLLRRDFVCNANDSYWMTNPAAPLTGYSPFYGDAGDRPLSPRTRMNLTLLTDTSPSGPSGADGKFDAGELERAILGNRSFTAELLRDAVVKRCRAATTGAGAAGDQKVADLATGCALLAAWDGRFDPDSRGAVVWRELLGSFSIADYYEGRWFSQRFDPARPLATPAGLPPAPADGPDPILDALAASVARLRQAGLDPAGPLAELQFTDKAGHRLPIHGGIGIDGVTNKATYHAEDRTMMPGFDPGATVNPRTGLTRRGYPVNYGTSFLMVVDFADRVPRARAILTYSASGDPDSPHYADQTRLYADKKLRPIRFTSADIAADPALVVEQVSGD